jgi:dCMP deaminase
MNNVISNWHKKIIEFESSDKIFRNRAKFHDYFLGLAFAVSTRSMDAQTRHGTLLVDANNHILSTGYNSFPRKMRDELLPNIRPAKYRWMIHSEIAALANITVGPWQNHGIIAYITGKPCLQCLMSLWNAGIEHLCIADRAGWSMDDTEKENWDFFVCETKINIEYIKPNLDWLQELVNELKEFGFITKI